MSVIFREDAIEAITNYAKFLWDNYHETCHLAGMIDTIDALPAAEPRWTPVTEGLPEEGKDVLVCDAYGFIYTAECEVISDDEWLDWQWYESVEYLPKDDVVAWMPLPEPWKEKKDDDRDTD
jgi:hypothetical protein